MVKFVDLYLKNTKIKHNLVIKRNIEINMTYYLLKAKVIILFSNLYQRSILLSIFYIIIVREITPLILFYFKKFI